LIVVLADKAAQAQPQPWPPDAHSADTLNSGSVSRFGLATHYGKVLKVALEDNGHAENCFNGEKRVQ
jgi:hypothetical protein